MGPSVIDGKLSEASIYLIPSISPSPLTLLLLLSSQHPLLPPLRDRTINAPPCLLSSSLALIFPPPLPHVLHWLKFCFCFSLSHESVMRPEQGAPAWRFLCAFKVLGVKGGGEGHAACVISLFCLSSSATAGQRGRKTSRGLSGAENKKNK